RPTVVYLGLLTEAQGVDLLLASAARLAPGPRRPQLLVLGYPDEPRWRERARAAGLEQDVLFPGKVAFDAAPAHVALGHLAVSPRRPAPEATATLPLSMPQGLASLALAPRATREVLGPDGLYAPDDPRAFAAAIERALADPDDLARRGAL